MALFDNRAYFDFHMILCFTISSALILVALTCTEYRRFTKFNFAFLLSCGFLLVNSASLVLAESLGSETCQNVRIGCISMNLFWVIGYGYSYLRIYALSNKRKLYKFLFPALLIIYLAVKAFICISQPIVVVRYQICIPQMPIHLSGLSNGVWILLTTAEFIFYAIELYFHYRNSGGLFSILSDFRDVLYALVPLSITQITLNIVKLAIPGGTVFTTIAYAQCIIEYLFLYRSICIFSNNNTNSHGAATVNGSATKTKSNNP